VTRTASACAQWGFPQSTSPLLPITISLCDFQPALNGTRQLIQYANPQSNQPCPRGSGLPPGGFGWIDETGCVVTVHNGSLNGEPGNSYPNDCDAVMNSLAGKTVLVPVFDSVTGTGNNAVYHVYGFAAFVITGWKFSGGSGLPQVLNDPAAPSCTGSCRGIQGYFTHWAAPVGGQLGGVDLGLTVINLVR
jgi:hypothetical protein